jgi:hypothetical protein
MPTFAAELSVACTRWGNIGVLLRSVAQTLATTSWIGVFAVARYSRDSYLYFVLAHWAFISLVWYALVGLSESRQPNAHCTGGLPIGLPARPIYLVYDYLTVAALHDIYWGNWRRVGWMRWFTMAGMAGLLPLAYTLTGNYSTLQCLYSALIGAGMGALFSALMFRLWVHYLAALDSYPVFAFLGWKHDPQFQQTWPL